MKSCKKGYYYCNTDKKCKPIPEGSVVRDDGFLMKETLDKKDKPFIKKLVKKLRGGSKTHAKQADDLEQAMNEEGLRAWFGKSSGTTKSGRKVKGWVQVGGKYDGKPCARQPGQKTTPKCVSSSKRRSMSDKERDSAARRKRAADPNQPQKSGAAAPTMVSTDPKRKMKEEFTTLPLRLEVPKSAIDFKQGLMFRESLDIDSGMLFVFDNIAQQSFHMTETKIPLDIAFIREDGVIESIKQLEPNNPVPVYSEGAIELAIEVNRGWFAENNVEVGDQLDVEYIIPNQREKYRSETNTIYDIINEVKDKKGKGSGTKDACYHKVKSRYSVWPSAYASGALVKCRKVGAANWGNKSEAYEVTNADKKGNTPAYQGLKSGKKNKLTGEPLYKAASHMKEGVVDIQNSDGQTIAGVVDIIGPANMKPITNDNGVWQGTEQVDDIEEGLGKRLAAAGAAAMLAGSGAGAAKAANYSGHVNFKYGSTPSKVTNKSISKGVDSAIKNIGSKGQSTVEKKGSHGLKLGGGIDISMAGSTSKTKDTKDTVKPDKTKDPKENKVKPSKTKDPKGNKVKPDKTKVKPDKSTKTKIIKTIKSIKSVKGDDERPNKTSGNDVKTSTPSPSTNVLTKGSTSSSPSTSVNTSSPSTSVLQKTKTKPSTPVRPVRSTYSLGEKRDEYGDPVGGPKISKKQKAKNLASNTPDEQHTTTTSEAMNPAQQAAIAISKKQRIMDLMVAKKKKKSMKEENLDEKCWKGYEKKGMKTMFGKRYPNCVKKKVGESVSDWRSEIGYEGKDEVKKLSEDDMKGMSVKSGHKRPTKSGAGMTQKGVEAYRRRNPGSKLKTAVTTKPSKLKKGSKAANRRKSYCARSAGQMKKFPKAAKDPNSRLRQARRRWNC